MFLNTIFNEISFNLTNGTIPNENPYISEENDNEGYIFLLFIDLIIFCFLTYITYNSSSKLSIESSSENYNIQFIKWLVLANGLRTLSLIFILIICNPNGNNGISWVNTVLHVVPAFVFVSSYMHLATFLSDLYYKYEGCTYYIYKSIFALIVNFSYIFLGLVAVITLFAHRYKIFFYISELLMAFLYLILGSRIIYYGRKVIQILKLQSNYNPGSTKIGKRIGFMAMSIGGLFLLKGVSGLLGGIGAYDPPNHNVYDFFWFLILEVLPTIIFIWVADAQKGEPDINLESQRSTLNDQDSANNSQRETSFRPNFIKNSV